MRRISPEVLGAEQSGGDKAELPYGDFGACESTCDNVQGTVEWIILSLRGKVGRRDGHQKNRQQRLCW